MAGEALPEEIVKRVELKTGLQFYLTGFYDLGTERPIGFSSVGPIPWRAKIAYAAHYGLDRFETESFISIIDRLDADYLESVKPKSPPNGKPKRPS